ncbi:unnamed protein product [Rotaria sp. Silwood2]|nr:unnamed protein product [Rotaria sp. Silwood2]CAF3081682.1 unnamed protein product [Rotaria sp. Silwood2]CAF3392099.1 unnamed protein product [Rotaria sp. Silwood2]CAF4198725.1 unnamed protein product [Rotaria sp. Silwood2]CAF4359523.1 unnamed protein product [Rotaria sp. Silwood2]
MYYNELDRFGIIVLKNFIIIFMFFFSSNMDNEELNLNRTYETDNGISYNSSINQLSTQILNPNIRHISTSMDIMNLSPHMKIQLCFFVYPSDSINSNGMIISKSGGPSYSSKCLLPSPLSSNTIQQHLHHLPPPHYIKMQYMDPLFSPPSNHQQQYMDLLPMMDDSFGMEPPPHHTLMHSSNRQSRLNDSLYLSILDDVRNFP